jgi:acyl carrier protein
MTRDMATVEVKEQVRRFLSEKLVQGRAVQLGDATSLVASDLLDSTAVLELASFLQETFGISIRDDELVLENIDSVGAIADFVERKGVDGHPA